MSEQDEAFSFTRYLQAKQSVDDRALNTHVLEVLKRHLPAEPLRIIEIGAGIGTMLRRLLRWDVVHRGEYVMVDQMRENIEFAAAWLPQWASELGLRVEASGEGELRVVGEAHDFIVRLEQADMFDYIGSGPAPADVLIAHAVLDLLPMPESMPKVLSLTKKLAWLTINFDGLTSLQPAIEPELDDRIVRRYHASMDRRPSGGDSRSGRHLFAHVRAAGAEVIAAGASDWVVHAVAGKYPEDEAYFLQCILHFFEESLTGDAELNASEFTAWMEKRREQVRRGELVYIAHQVDMVVRRGEV